VNSVNLIDAAADVEVDDDAELSKTSHKNM